jgi:hypothetical protein
MSDDSANMVWLYEGGAWRQIADPIDWSEGDDVRARYTEAGYAQAAGHVPFLEVGHPDALGTAGYVAGLTLWVRAKSPECLIDVGGTDSSSRPVYAASLPDGLDLMARWAPIVQASTLVDLIAGITKTSYVRGQERPGGTGIVERIMARVAGKDRAP